MLKITKQQLQDLFDGSKTWEEMAQEFSTEANLEVTPKMVQDLFKVNGFNLRSRKRKTEWFTIIDDVTPVPTFSNPQISDDAVVNASETEQYA